MRRILVFIIFALLASCFDANGQNLLKRLGQRAKNAVENKLGEKVEQGVNDVLDGKIGKKEKEEEEADKQAADTVSQEAVAMPDAKVPAQPKKQVETSYAKSDFVAGDEIIFEDLLTGEQLGEFPSKWDLMSGVVEIAKLNGENTINFVEDESRINPLMEDPRNYLPEIFTVEYDFWLPGMGLDVGYTMRFSDQERNDLWIIELSRGGWKSNDSQQFNFIEMTWEYRNPSDENIHGQNENVSVSGNGWNHFALSFNKRALKIYINGIRIANIPNAKKPQWWSIYNNTWGGFEGKGNMRIKNIRIAKGAVPLYDRMMTDGKFITYGITFDVGKSTIKPESMGEINRIVQLMNENPTLKFSVEGHTDSTGNPTSNQTLSEQRSQAIVAKLVELGIAQDRLTAVGKGQNSPISDNNTDEGRAKNRRVEFVKMTT